MKAIFMNIKRKILFCTVLILAFCLTYFNYRNKTDLNEFELANVEALADAEIEVGPFCVGNYGFCIVYTNGFFILGYRQYF